MLSRDAILSIDDLPFVEVNVPEWGGTVFVRMMTGAERDRYESQHVKDPYADARARMAVATLCDENRRLLFTPADISAMSAKSGTALDRIFAASLKLNRFTKEDIADLGKASPPVPSGGSPSDSR